MVQNNRNDFRIRVCIEVLIGTLRINGNEIKLPKNISSKLIDLSSTGLKLVTLLDIPEHATFMFNIDIEEELIYVEAEIVWREQGDIEYTYGCKLINLNIINQQKLRKYVYNEQIRIAKLKKKNN